MEPYEVVWELEKVAWGDEVPYPIPENQRENFRRWRFTEDTEKLINEMVKNYGFKDNEAINALQYHCYKTLIYEGKVIRTEDRIMTLIRDLARQGLVAHEIVWKLEEIAYGYKVKR